MARIHDRHRDQFEHRRRRCCEPDRLDCRRQEDFGQPWRRWCRPGSFMENDEEQYGGKEERLVIRKSKTTACLCEHARDSPSHGETHNR